MLGPEHIDWAAAIVMHSNMFYSPVWPVIYPEKKTARLMAGQKAADYLIRHQIESGYSLGVFDKEYKFKRPESASTGGKLYWDLNDETSDQDQLLEQMDFPLVSVALAYDSINHLDMEKLGPLISVLPAFAIIYGALPELDKRDPATWEAKAPGEVIFRNATSTRHEYEGQGIMAALARYMMRWVAEKGFRGIQIETVADAVNYVWSKPPAPFSGEVVAAFETETFEMEGEEGKRIRPFVPAKQRVTKVYCKLK